MCGLLDVQWVWVHQWGDLTRSAPPPLLLRPRSAAQRSIAIVDKKKVDPMMKAMLGAHAERTARSNAERSGATGANGAAEGSPVPDAPAAAAGGAVPGEAESPSAAAAAAAAGVAASSAVEGGDGSSVGAAALGTRPVAAAAIPPPPAGSAGGASAGGVAVPARGAAASADANVRARVASASQLRAPRPRAAPPAAAATDPLSRALDVGTDVMASEAADGAVAAAPRGGLFTSRGAGGTRVVRMAPPPPPGSTYATAAAMGHAPMINLDAYSAQDAQVRACVCVACHWGREG